jgi:hypothetical protein
MTKTFLHVGCGHTFTLRQLARPDINEVKVAAWMGVAVKEMQRYRGLLMEPVDVI